MDNALKESLPRYDASSITILTGLDAVRRRPAMYIGSTGRQGVHHLVLEVVQNSIDEALAGYCTRIDLDLFPDGSCRIEDDGRGIPVDNHPLTGRPTCEVVLTTLHAGGKFESGAYTVAGGLHGVGLSCVNALSEWLTLDIWKEGFHYRQTFSRGHVEQALERVEETSKRGTALHFKPDPLIFTEVAVPDWKQLSMRMQEQAFLHPGIRMRLRRHPGEEEEVYCYESGIAGFVEHLNAKAHVLHPDIIRLQGEYASIVVDAALQWTRGYAEQLRSYTNSIFTSQGGTHLEGLKSAIVRSINRFAVHNRLINADTDEKIAGYDAREGLTAVLSIQMVEPEFEGQTKSVLTSKSAMRAVEEIVYSGLNRWFEEHREAAIAVVGKALEASRARAAARKAGERARYQTVDSIISKEVYRKQFGIRSRNWHESARWITDEKVLGAHAELCKMPRDAKVLDVCCGSGVVGNAFRGRVGTIIGLDLTPEMIALSKTRLDEVVKGDVYEIPFDEASFDMVVNREVLHLLPRPEIPVAEIFRVLRPGGQFVVGQILPYGPLDAPWMFRIFKKKQPLFFNCFTEESFRLMLENAGFIDIEMKEILQWEDIDNWITTHETPNLYRHEIRDLYYHAPAEVRSVHPFEVQANGAIMDQWRWGIFSAFKPR